MSAQGNITDAAIAVFNYGQACADAASVNAGCGPMPDWWGDLADDDDAVAEAGRRIDAAWLEVFAALRALARTRR